MSPHPAPRPPATLEIQWGCREADNVFLWDANEAGAREHCEKDVCELVYRFIGPWTPDGAA